MCSLQSWLELIQRWKHVRKSYLTIFFQPWRWRTRWCLWWAASTETQPSGRRLRPLAATSRPNRPAQMGTTSTVNTATFRQQVPSPAAFRLPWTGYVCKCFKIRPLSAHDQRFESLIFTNTTCLVKLELEIMSWEQYRFPLLFSGVTFLRNFDPRIPKHTFKA